ncbi:cation:proton antiporter [Lichenihabitans psoromatis]|uniref:cation:proton antiporter domain-containing protein n=1 Tax=Lichenihabitans psoromatis TaxID=2528642 RepID=UPI001FE15241|nr:cation:proton antiporter [Lichenihabitans psoromatis]
MIIGPLAVPIRGRTILLGLCGIALAGACAQHGGLSALVSNAAFAADGQSGLKLPSEAIFVAEVVALLVVGRLFGEIMLRLGQPAVVGQLLAGIVLGPSVFGLLLPDLHNLVFPGDHAQRAMIDGVAQLGVLLLLLLTGMETDVGLVRSVGKPAASVSIMGIAVPFGCGVLLGLYGLPDSLLPNPSQRVVTALFLGTALSISSIKIVAMVIDEMHFMRRNLGQIIVASAIIDDTVGWIIVAVTFGLARPGGLNLFSLVGSVGGTIIFLVVSATLGRRVVAALIRWANDHLVSAVPAVTMILVIMGVMALITNAIGVNTVLGAFVAGVLVAQSPILTKQVEAELRGLVVALFAPIFFGLAGLGTDLTLLKDPTLLALTAGLVLIASLGKFGGAFLGGKIGGLSRDECLALALGMNARGSTEVIVATLGLSVGALDKTLFTMIVTMAVLTTMAMPPTLRWALARLPMNKDESERLDREAFEKTAFLSNVERLLVAVDDGASGKLASRLAGLLGRGQALPITAMSLDASQRPPVLEQAGAGVMASGDRARLPGSEDDAAAVPMDVTERPITGSDPIAAVGAEARKGYGLLMIGIEPATTPEGGLDPRLAEVVKAFSGARAIVVARGLHRTDPVHGPLQFLIPTSGTGASRRASELGFALARASGASVTALFVGDPIDAPRSGKRRRAAAAEAKSQMGADILRQTAALAARFDITATPVVRQASDKDAAILGQARRAGDTVIVLGVSMRPSDRVLFGALADSLLEGSQHSLLLLVDDSGIGLAG